MTDLIAAMQEQLAADRVGDALALARLQDRLERLGDAIAVRLPDSLRRVLLGMRRLIYMPHPYANTDEFPLGALRIGGRFLGRERTDRPQSQRDAPERDAVAEPRRCSP